MGVVSLEVSYTILAIQIAIFTLMGYYVGKKFVKTSEDFLVAGRRLPWFGLAGSIIVTWIWASTVLASGEAAYVWGFPAIWIYPISGISLATLLPVFKILRREVPKGITFLDYISMKFGRATHLLALIITILITAITIFYVFLGLGFGLEPILGVPWWQLMLIGGLTVVLYSWFGGLWSSVLTDIIQYSIVWILTTVAILLSLNSIGGIGALYEGLLSKGITKGIALLTSDAYAYYFLPIVGWIFYAMIDQTIWQRVYALKEEKDLSKMLVFAWIGWSFYPMVAGIAGLIALYLGLELEVGSLAFPMVIAKLTPIWISIAFCFIVFNAVLSTLDSLLCGMTALIVDDLYIKYVAHGPPSEKTVYKLSKVTIVAAGLILMVLTMLFPASIMFVGLYLSAFLASLSFPLVIGILLPKKNRWAVFTAILINIILTLTLWTATYFGYIKEIAGVKLESWAVLLLMIAISSVIEVCWSYAKPEEVRGGKS